MARKQAPLHQFRASYKTVRTVHGSDARTAIINGVKMLSRVSQKTLGPGGRNVALEYEGGDPKITKDGVTVVKSVNLNDRAEEMGSKLLKKATGATNIYAGDGTTTSAILSREILQAG